MLKGVVIRLIFRPVHLHSMLWRLSVFLLKATALSLFLAVVVGISLFTIYWIRRPVPGSPEDLLFRADKMAWNNDWSAAAPLYAKAEMLFRAKGDASHALYAEVSRVPVLMETTSLPSIIAELNRDLKLPSAADPAVRLRVLEVKGRCEEEYDADLAANTFAQVQSLAFARHRLYHASRASGERGIMLFTLGKFEEARGLVMRAYFVANYLHDPAAHVRFASMIGKGLTQMGRPKQALKYLDEAIATQKQYPQVASPYVAISAKVDCLSALGRNVEALSLADNELARLRKAGHLGQLQSLLTTRAEVMIRVGRTQEAIRNDREALVYATRLSAWRAVTDIDGELANAYRRSGDLASALLAVNDAIRANAHAPDEIFLVPGNLALKAKILADMGKRSEAEGVYEKGTQIVDVLLSAVPTVDIEESLLAQMGSLYAGYFQLLSDQGRLSEAFSVIERGRGRIEEQRLTFDRTTVPQSGENRRTRIQDFAARLLEARDIQAGALLLQQAEIPSTMSGNSSGIRTASLQKLQADLHKAEILVEYVLDDPASFALVITSSTAERLTLPRKAQIEGDAERYREVMLKHSSDRRCGQKLFGELLPFLDAYPHIASVIVVADGDLHLLPFSAIVDKSGKYLVQERTVTMTPSATVLCTLRGRTASSVNKSKSYLGVAPWVNDTDQKDWVLAKRGGDRTFLTPLPHTRDEVESIAAMMPKQATVLVGDEATRNKFASLPLHDYRVLHLALHGLVDPIFPDRSALVFAPTKNDDGYLEARDIRNLHLRADLVTLSACNTGVGPASSAGVESLHSAFIEAGADTVVSSLWELDDAKTDTLMKSFYRHLRDEDKASALRDAELELMQKSASPYYWAAFEVVGNPSGSPLYPSTPIAQR